MIQSPGGALCAAVRRMGRVTVNWLQDILFSERKERMKVSTVPNILPFA